MLHFRPAKIKQTQLWSTLMQENKVNSLQAASNHADKSSIVMIVLQVEIPSLSRELFLIISV